MAENERQQRLIERVQEDERLRGDLEGDVAKALVQWASERVGVAAADPTRPDAEVEAEAQAIRAAARTAARAGESDARQVVALAEEMLRQGIGASASPPPPAASTTESAAPANTGVVSDSYQAPAAPRRTEVAQRLGGRLRRRWRERFKSWFRRKDQ